MIGRPATSQEISALKAMCYRSFDFGQDVHCEETAGFGLSFDHGSVREVYLYNYDPPDQESFPGSLPGDVTWDSTLSDITSTLGQPDCVSSIIGFDANYTLDGYDVEYNVEASHDPTARLLKITIRPLDDRPSSCHAPTWEVGS